MVIKSEGYSFKRKLSVFPMNTATCFAAREESSIVTCNRNIFFRYKIKVKINLPTCTVPFGTCYGKSVNFA